MKLFLSISLLVFVVSIAQSAESDELLEKQVSLFSQFKRKYNKNYETKEESALRFNHFRESLKRSESRNNQSKGGAVFGVTKFSDLSPSEFKAMYLTLKPEQMPKQLEGTVSGYKPMKAVPNTFDWRSKGAVTPVKDQGTCGSCWAFSTVETIESKWILAGRAKADTLKLSPQQLVDCNDASLGCNGGIPALAFEYVMFAGGVESEQDYPYKAVSGSCKFNESKVVAKVKTWKSVTWSFNEAEIKDKLVQWGPLSVCVDANSWQDYQSGVMTASQCAEFNLLDHAVQLVGYNTDPVAGNYWIVRNSWNTDWGINGYIYLAMGTDTCGIADLPTAVFV
eukprot:TRINITY_DN2538_c0_g1_i1.p1 TRINITY_DN2538_c0_g1~~TRINITY_DN2538_c0_g1_i1.p1  ORF type:complete len:337 (+),score=86.34 TRINITY_DN2538_c0_g1_i1:127-1137(+)